MANSTIAQRLANVRVMFGAGSHAGRTGGRGSPDGAAEDDGRAHGRKVGSRGAGQSEIAPTAVRVTLRLDVFKQRLDALPNPRVLALGAFDLAFVFVYLLPLLMLALGYDLVSGERERGTLLLLLAQPVALSRLLVAKLLVRLGAFTVLVVGVLFVANLASARPAGVAQLGLVFLASAVHGAFWLLVAGAIQRLRCGSGTNALLALVAFLALAVVIPGVVRVALHEVVPVPTRAELSRATRDAQRVATENEDRALAAYYDDHPGFASEENRKSFWTHWVVRSRHVDEAVRPLQARFDAALAGQARAARVLAVLSPTIAYEELLGDLGAGGSARHRAFAEQTRAFAGSYRLFFEERVLRGEALAARDLQAVPRFAFVEESDGSVGVRAGGYLLELLALVVSLGIVAARGAEREAWVDER